MIVVEFVIAIGDETILLLHADDGRWSSCARVRDTYRRWAARLTDGEWVEGVFDYPYSLVPGDRFTVNLS